MGGCFRRGVLRTRPSLTETKEGGRGEGAGPERVKRGCRSRVDKPRGTRAPLRTASTWRTVSPIPFFPRSPCKCRPESVSYDRFPRLASSVLAGRSRSTANPTCPPSRRSRRTFPRCVSSSASIGPRRRIRTSGHLASAN